MGRLRIALVTLIVGMFLMLAPLGVGASPATTAPASRDVSAAYLLRFTDCMYYYNDLYYCAVYSYDTPYSILHQLGLA